jgi:hypothetical protein
VLEDDDRLRRLNVACDQEVSQASNSQTDYWDQQRMAASETRQLTWHAPGEVDVAVASSRSTAFSCKARVSVRRTVSEGKLEIRIAPVCTCGSCIVGAFMPKGSAVTTTGLFEVTTRFL